MPTPRELAHTLNKSLMIWLKGTGRLVIGLDGYAGSGKTTLADEIEKINPHVLVIHLDDFIRHWKVRKNLVEASSDPAILFEHSWYRYEELEKLIAAFRHGEKNFLTQTYDFEKNDFGPAKEFDLSKTILLVEGIFLFSHRNPLGNLWDKRVYIELDFTEADKQRIAREQERWGAAYVPEDHPDNWTKYFKKHYRKYWENTQPQKFADLVLKR